MGSREEKPLGLNVGSASILMIFAVLCLTVFSALSLVTAISEKNTADHFAESTVQYYAADAEAIEIKEALLTSLRSGSSAAAAADSAGAVYASSPEGDFFSYAVPLEDGISQLSVVLVYRNGALDNVTWEKTSTDEWSPDSSIQVWDLEAAAKAAEAAEK
ncbi:MAG: hypothetical protein ACI4VM_07755 [Anaerovoracaceae bacterium]